MDRADPDRAARRVGAVAAIAGVGAAAGTLVLTRLAWPSVPFPPASAAQWLVQRAPGRLATAAIELLGHAALPLAFAAVAVGTVLLAALAGAALARGSPVRAAAVPLLGWVAAVLLLPTGPEPGVVASALAWLPAALVGVGVAAWTARWISRDAAEDDAPKPSALVSRRTVLVAAGVGVGAVAVGGLAAGVLRSARRLPPSLEVPNLVSPSAGLPPGAFPPIPGLVPRITPLLDFYVVDQALIDPVIDAETFRLTVDGDDRSVSLRLADVMEMPAVERFQTLECISNEVGGALISTTSWTGAPLAEVLDLAGVGTASVEVVFRCADGYSESLPVEVAMDPSTLLVYGMDGRELLREHGFPLRVLSVGTYGMKNPKWITSIQVTSVPHTGFWERRGWSPSGRVKTMSRLDVPRRDEIVEGPAMIAGVAFAGDRRISRVDVSTDGGGSWSEAEVEPAVSGWTWVRWRRQWSSPSRGEHRLVVRAWDGADRVQTTLVSPPHPDGASGLHSVTVQAL